ncbi:MAG: type II toxin-antitoxin system RelE/ParE family toxin [Rhodospirillaceae bacterium]|nr:type II toxin-antitoxin system RelE/ParE family toxin [Rhodospirillaceae bacterium]
MDVDGVPRPVPLDWVGDAKRRYAEFPAAVQRDMGRALLIAQYGGVARSSKPWKGLGPGVFELVESHFGDAYRAVYAVKFKYRVYVLHAFKKKSKSGAATPLLDVELIRIRLKAAQADYSALIGKEMNND